MTADLNGRLICMITSAQHKALRFSRTNYDIKLTLYFVLIFFSNEILKYYNQKYLLFVYVLILLLYNILFKFEIFTAISFFPLCSL